MRKTPDLLTYICLVLSGIIFFSTPLLHASDDYEIYVAKGIQKINKGQYHGAVEMLEKASGLAPDDPEVVYYSAVAYSRTGNYEKAKKLFLRILEDDPSALNAYLEIGRIYYIQSECVKADEYLSNLISLTEDPALKRYAESMIGDCSEKETVKEERDFDLSITLGGQYDSNVILESDNPSVVTTRERKSDSRLIAYLSAGAKMYEDSTLRLDVDYSLYLSKHTHLDDLNVQYHKISPKIEILNFPGMIVPMLGYSFEYTQLGSDHYSNRHGVFGGVVIKEGEGFSTDISYKFTKSNLFDSGMYATNSLRTGDEKTVEVAQKFVLKKVRFNINYSMASNEASVGYWDYDSDKAGAEVSYAVTSPVKLNMTFSANHHVNRYKSDYPGFGYSRSDKLNQYNVMLTCLGFKNAAVTLMNSYSTNKSNINLFDYDRNIISLFLTMRVL